MYELPVDYTKLDWRDRKAVRQQYMEEQDYLCYYCGSCLSEEAPQSIRDKEIN